MFKTSTVFFFVIELQEFEYNLIDIHNVMCHWNWHDQEQWNEHAFW